MIRWTAKKKHAVVREVISGALTFDQACEFFNLSVEELREWVRRSNNGFSLKATRRYNPIVIKVAA